MIYLISQDWINTTNNHAGIKYLCNQLSARYADQYKSFVIPDFSADKRSGSLLRNKINVYIQKYQHRSEEIRILSSLEEKLCNGDIVFLMEYLDKGYEMHTFAKKIKEMNPSIRIFAMAHLVPEKFDRNFRRDSELISWLRPVEKLFTLGTSLTSYLIKRGVDKNKIVSSFHYVDDYYINKNPIVVNDPITVIAMGNQVRNIDLLKIVVDENPTTRFIICQGVLDMSGYFAKNDNVKLIPFVEEDELRRYMEQADISLNVMNDTIGSNVIVTSLAMGLAMICSDVGSIHNYCDNSNTFFCKNSDPDSFSKAIAELQDKKRLLSMRIAATQSVRRFRIEEFHKFINAEVNNLLG